MTTETNTNVKYYRVLPRDLFNEAKLLKCIGRLCLLIHDRLTPVEMSFRENGQHFKIGLMDDGHLTITNLTIEIKGMPYRFKTSYNSKSNYPLLLDYNYCETLVFDEEGNFSEEFIQLVNTF